MVRIPKAEMLDPKSLIPYEKNVKKHTDSQVDGIMESMKKFGFYAPVVVDGKKNVIIGHGRLLASIKLGLKEIPVIKEKNITEAEAKALRIIDNRISEVDWDIDNLKLEMDDLKEFNFDDFAVNLEDLYQPKLQDINIDIDQTDEKMKAYLEGSVKQITLIFSNEEFERTLSRMEKCGQELKAESNTEVLLKLLDFYESN
jgi:ParB-like chromosome segregation protein Spo0J